MQQNFPECIKNDKDLMYYERHLKSMANMREESNDSLSKYHKNMIGKMVKVESLIGNRLMHRVGTLLEINDHHIVIKPSKNAVTVMIPMNSVKYVTVIHGSIC